MTWSTTQGKNFPCLWRSSSWSIRILRKEMPLTTDWREFSSREAAKIMVMAIALVMVAPFAGLERLLRGCFKRDVLFLGQGEALSLVPAKFGRYLRNAYYYFT